MQSSHRQSPYLQQRSSATLGQHSSSLCHPALPAGCDRLSADQPCAAPSSSLRMQTARTAHLRRPAPRQAPAYWTGQGRCSAAMCSGLTCRGLVQCSHVPWPHLQRLGPRLGSAPQTAATTPSRRLAAGRDRLRHCASCRILPWDASPPQGLLVAEARRDALQHRCDGVCPAEGRLPASMAAACKPKRPQRDLA